MLWSFIRCMHACPMARYALHRACVLVELSCPVLPELRRVQVCVYFCRRLKIGDFFSWIGTEPSGVPGIVLVRFWV
jgi:hemolysin-activating ACP:hemolysin acyltransferase